MRIRTQDHVLVGSAGRDHGEHVLVLVDFRIDDARAVPVRQGFLEHPPQVRRALDPEPLGSVGLGDLHEVRVAHEVHAGEAVLVEQVLPLPDHAEVAVVDDHDLHRELVDHRGGEL
jgi:hypothetical protein